MPYEAKFNQARTAFMNGLKSLKPTPSIFMMDLVKQDLLKNMAENLDAVNGKTLQLMQDAWKNWDSKSTNLLGRMGKQAQREVEEIRPRIKPLQEAFDKVVKGIGADYGKIVSQRKLAEEKERLTAARNATTKAAADAGKERLLRRSIEEVEKRRDAYRDAMEKIESEFSRKLAEFQALAKTAREAVGEVLAATKEGKLDEARTVAGDALRDAKKARELANKAELDFKKRVTDEFQEDRKLSTSKLPSYLGKDQKAEFDRQQGRSRDAYDKALALEVKTQKHRDLIVKLAHEVETAAEQADAAAQGKDVIALALKTLAAAQGEVSRQVAEIRKILAEGATKVASARDLAKLARSLDAKATDQKIVDQRKEAVDRAKKSAREIDEVLASVDDAQESYETMTKTAVGKVSMELRREPKVKDALAKLGADAAGLMRAIDESARNADQVLRDLKAL